MKRHLCRVMESDDNKGSLGISICPRVSREEREKYIKIEQAAQRMHGKKQKVQSHGSSTFGGYTTLIKSSNQVGVLKRTTHKACYL